MKINPILTRSNLTFNARLIIPKKENVCELAGEFCAEQLEKARPTIEKIAAVTKDIKEITITPVCLKNSTNKNSKSSQIKIDVQTNKGMSTTHIADERVLNQDNPFQRPFYKYIVDTLVDAIGGARLCDAIFSRQK